MTAAKTERAEPFEAPVGPPDRCSALDTPIGPLLLTGNGLQLQVVAFPDGSGAPAGCELPEDAKAFAEVREQLAEYFAGERETFQLRLAPTGPRFALSVWAELTRIPYGETAGYGEIAERIGAPGAARAVGSANHINPIPIIVPCHRVIGADGSMVGFGGGLPVKHALLAVEQPTLF